MSMTATVASPQRRRWAVRAALVLLALAFLGSVASRFGDIALARKPYAVPQSARLESDLGIRFSRAAVVADGGIVELRYTVLDAEKASRFQNDTHHPPVLRSEKRRGDPLYRTALMKQGHTLRAGQTYYVLYLNNHHAVRSGETLEIDAGGTTLTSVPVR